MRKRAKEIGFKTRPSTYKIGVAPTGRARCRCCKRLITKGETRILITAFVMPGRATVFSRCCRCLDTRFTTAVLDVYLQTAPPTACLESMGLLTRKQLASALDCAILEARALLGKSGCRITSSSRRASRTLYVLF